MPKSSNQKLKLLYLAKLFNQKTDENHKLTIMEIIKELESEGINAERKSLYDDIEALRLFGLDILKSKDKSTSYYLASREFELPELKLLVDSVQASKFITLKKSQELIAKIENLASCYDASILQRQVYVINRIKNMNESIYYNVDKIHSAISSDNQISFNYFEYTIKKERCFKKNGEKYVISPYALTWDDENYYMLGFDNVAQIIKHYRVDKMANISLTDSKRDGKKEFSGLDLGIYSKKIFSMFGGIEQNVKLEFENKYIGVVIDRFGKEIIVARKDENRFTICVNVFVSPQFFSWVLGFGEGVRIISPDNVVLQMKQNLESLTKIYN